MYSVITIADEMLRIAKKGGRKLTPLQLMKLVYIAHGWHLAIFDKDLFQEKIEAWKFGPVIPDLYHATKSFGRSPIPLDLIKDEGGVVDEDTSAFLADVFEKYGHLSAFALSNLTHQAGTPWHTVYEDGLFGIEIPDSLIAQHYAALTKRKPSPARKPGFLMECTMRIWLIHHIARMLRVQFKIGGAPYGASRRIMDCALSTSSKRQQAL